ncbi:sodium-coupled monocarboxylate transporter 1-like [Amphiura filiformis]|uniref:sodium-coupled monocarboxylate transporter 1-like n=1 Tax=Amphiura filiformis TaxID=82378 RepID=UPI003B21AD1D
METAVGLFSIADYVVLSVMLLISMTVGIYQAFTGGKQRTNDEFLLANRNMNLLPVAMSFMASFVSAPAILGVAGEVYVSGIHWGLNILAVLFAGIIACRFFIPVYFRLEIVSAYEYLELRFNRAVRICGVFSFMGLTPLFMGLVMYGPALALNVVAGISLWGSVIITGVVCTIYTSVGGMKAVLWTDVFQILFIFAGILSAVIEGCRRIGNVSDIWAAAVITKRLDFNFNPDPSIRHTFWTVFVGGIFFWGQIYTVNQTMVQRYLTLRSEREAKIAVAIGVAGVMVIFLLVCIAGVTMYAYYEGCDPLTLGLVQKPDQMLVYYIMDLFRNTPGIPGLFVASIFSATLSTVSSGVNALAAVTVQDIIRPHFKGIPERRMTRLAKVVGFCFGLLAVLISYIISLLGSTLLQFVFNIFALFCGPLLGLFCLGMFLPWSNSKGAVSGYCFAMLLTSTIIIGSIIHPDTTATNKLPLSAEFCQENTGNVTFTTDPAFTMPSMNTTTSGMDTDNIRSVASQVFSVSYAWYTCIGCLATVVVGLLVSFITGPTNPQDLDPKTFMSVADAMYCCCPNSCKTFCRCGVTLNGPSDIKIIHNMELETTGPEDEK